MMSNFFRNIENPLALRTRSKRSALTDISNNVTVNPDPSTAKEQNPKKRRSRDGLDEPTKATNSTTNTETQQIPTIGIRTRSRASLEGKASLNTSSSSLEDSRLSTSSDATNKDSKTSKQKRTEEANDNSANKKAKLTKSEATEAKTVVTVPVVQISEESKRSEQKQRIRLGRKVPSLIKGCDPFSCVDILSDMYDIFYEKEVEFTPSMYLSKQPDLNAKMRSILVDWMLEVHHKFKLHPTSLWLSVNILDRYLNVVEIVRGKLQLVGVAALLIASKYEDVYAPEVKDCVYITDYAYDKEDVVEMESSILEAINYQIFVPTGYHFLSRYLDIIHAADRVRYLACYYAERNLQEYDSLKEKPHIFAAAALYAALRQCRAVDARISGPAWTKLLQEETGITESQLISCARVIVQHVNEESETASKRRLLACKKKYAADKYLNVASLILPHF